MLSKRTSGWKLHDWLVFLIILAVGVPLLIAAINGIAPNSGVAHALHTGGHTISNFFLWLSNAFTMIASWFNQW